MTPHLHNGQAYTNFHRYPCKPCTSSFLHATPQHSSRIRSILVPEAGNGSSSQTRRQDAGQVYTNFNFEDVSLLDDVLSGHVIPPIAPSSSPPLPQKQPKEKSSKPGRKGQRSLSASPSPSPSNTASTSAEDRAQAARRQARSQITRSIASRLSKRLPTQEPAPQPSPAHQLLTEVLEGKEPPQQHVETKQKQDEAQVQQAEQAAWNWEQHLMKQSSRAERQAEQQQEQTEHPHLHAEQQQDPYVPAPFLIPTAHRRRSRLFQLMEPVPVPIPSSSFTEGTDAVRLVPGVSTSSVSSSGSFMDLASTRKVSMGVTDRGLQLDGQRGPGSKPRAALRSDAAPDTQTGGANGGATQVRSRHSPLIQQQQHQRPEQDQGLVASSTRQRRSNRQTTRVPMSALQQQLQQQERDAARAPSARKARNLPSTPNTSWADFERDSNSAQGLGSSKHGASYFASSTGTSSGSGASLATEQGYGSGRSVTPSMRRRTVASPRGAPPPATPQQVLAEMAATADAQRALRTALIAHQERSRQQQHQQLIQEAEQAELEQELSRTSPQQRQQIEMLRQMAARAQDPLFAGFDGPQPSQLTPSPLPASHIDSNNWVAHARASFPHVYDPDYHITLYELLFDAWMELGKAHQDKRRDLVDRGYMFLKLCYQSPDVATRHVGVMSFAEALGDSESLQAAAAMHVQPQELLLDVLQPLVQWMHGDELGQHGLLHEFWSAAEARTLPDRRRREAKEGSLRRAAAAAEFDRQAAVRATSHKQRAGNAQPLAAAPSQSPGLVDAAPAAQETDQSLSQVASGSMGKQSLKLDLSGALEGSEAAPLPQRRGRGNSREKSEGTAAVTPVPIPAATSHEPAVGSEACVGSLEVQGAVLGGMSPLHASQASSASFGYDLGDSLVVQQSQADPVAGRSAYDLDAHTQVGHTGLGGGADASSKIIVSRTDIRATGGAIGSDLKGSSSDPKRLVGSEWEQLVQRLSALQVVHPAVPQAALICVVYD